MSLNPIHNHSKGFFQVMGKTAGNFHPPGGLWGGKEGGLAWVFMPRSLSPCAIKKIDLHQMCKRLPKQPFARFNE
jgi:hypothetical protein